LTLADVRALRLALFKRWQWRKKRAWTRRKHWRWLIGMGEV
jgi:membrane-anchored protein YejM (alkaline phosphatase superfamily)